MKVTKDMTIGELLMADRGAGMILAEWYALCWLPFRRRRNTGGSIHGTRHGLR